MSIELFAAMESSPKPPRKSHLITSPYFSSESTRAQAKRRVAAKRDVPDSPTSKRPDFMTFEADLPLGPEIDINAEPIVALTDDDVTWYNTQFEMFNNPSYAFKLRLSTYLNFALYRAKPILIQESLAHDPWKLLIAVMLLNKTAGKDSIPVFWKVLEFWPTPEIMRKANVDDIRSLIQPLGLQDVRAKRMISLSSQYLTDPPHPDRLCISRATFTYAQYDETTQRPKAIHKMRYPPTPISHLPGVGAYALDSYRIFCMPGDEWQRVLPTDKELIRYLKWKWAFEGCRWEPLRGLVAPLDAEHLEALPAILSS